MLETDGAGDTEAWNREETEPLQEPHSRPGPEKTVRWVWGSRQGWRLRQGHEMLKGVKAPSWSYGGTATEWEPRAHATVRPPGVGSWLCHLQAERLTRALVSPAPAAHRGD